MEGKPTTITPLQKEEKSCTLTSCVITIIALVVERVVVEGSGASNGISSSEELASVSRVAGVASPDKEFLFVEGAEVVGVLSLSPDPRSRTCNSTAGCFPIVFSCLFPPALPILRFTLEYSRKTPPETKELLFRNANVKNKRDRRHNLEKELQKLSIVIRIFFPRRRRDLQV